MYIFRNVNSKLWISKNLLNKFSCVSSVIIAVESFWPNLAYIKIKSKQIKIGIKGIRERNKWTSSYFF